MVQPSSESSLGFTSARLFLGQLLEQPSMFTGAVSGEAALLFP
jgi:hypothetical protein